MDIAFYIASVLGALGVYLMMPAAGPKPKKVGALLALAAGGGLLLFLLRYAEADDRPSLYFYIFALIAVASAVRVITHPRPVYSALFFVMVVLAASGLFLVLEAEFMAFAMIIIYAGAILVTYLFVIMLATLPQAEGQAEQAPEYDRVAREPLSAVLVGFALLAVLCHVVFDNRNELQPNPAAAAQSKLQFAVESIPGRIVPVLVKAEALDASAAARGAGLAMTFTEPNVIEAKWGERSETITLTDELKAQLQTKVANIDRVGWALFDGHALGIELAGVILLLSMVGAIVIGRKRVFVDDGEPLEPDLKMMHHDEPLSDVSVGEQV